MVYRLGLILDFRHAGKTILPGGSTVGAGFVWRTIARQLVRLIPGLELCPKKSAITLCGDVCNGTRDFAVVRDGTQVSRGDVEAFSKRALGQGKSLASSLADKAQKIQAPNISVPKITMPKMPFRKKKTEQLTVATGDARINLRVKFCSGTTLFMAVLDPIKANVLAVRIIPNVDRDFAEKNGITGTMNRCIGFFPTADIDDTAYSAIDEATETGRCARRVCKIHCTGSGHASGSRCRGRLSRFSRDLTPPKCAQRHGLNT